MEVFGIILDSLGVILVAFMALRVHHRVLSEQKIDKLVMRSMRREQILGILGVVLIIVGSIMQIMSLG